MPTRHTVPAPLRHIAQAALLLALSGGAGQALAINIDETFMNATAPGWALVTADPSDTSMTPPVLTSGGVDPAGDGWLRLTGDARYQANSAIYQQAFSSTDGVDVEFTYAMYPAPGAAYSQGDGLTFYLVDGSATPTAGGPGAALGYSWLSRTPPAPGVSHGYVALGLDEWGNFPTIGAGTCNNAGLYGQLCVGRSPNSVVVRGSGHLLGTAAAGDPQNIRTGFPLLHQSTQSGGIGTTDRAGAKKVRVVITPGPNVSLSAYIDGVNVVSGLELATASGPKPGMVALPPTFKMGFSASTGLARNFHEIRNLTVRAFRIQAEDDAYRTPMDTPLTVSVAGGLGSNDTSVLPDAVYTITTPPSSGTLTSNGNGSFTYTPATGFTGSVTFDYRVCNKPVTVAANCSTATATITVLPVPVAVDDSNSTPMNKPVSASVTGNDTVPGGATFSVTTAPDPTTEGTVTLDSSGNYTFTPVAGFAGVASFDYQICTGPGHTAPCDTATVRITVTPTATDDSYNGQPNQPVTGAVGGNDVAPAGGVFSLLGTGPNPLTEGTLTLNADGTFTFVPVASFSGVVSFQYQVCAAGGTPCATATASITIASAAIGVTAVPTLGHWSLMLMGLAAAGMGARRLRRKAG